MLMGPVTHVVGSQPTEPNQCFANACAMVSLGLCIVGLAYAIVSWIRVPTAATSQPANEERKKGVDLRIELSTKLFDLGLLLLGVLWGFVLADKAVYRFSRWQDLMLFTTSNLLLLISLFSHLVYRMRIANMLWLLGGAAAPGRRGNAASGHS
jgi:hypothetical protein